MVEEKIYEEFSQAIHNDFEFRVIEHSPTLHKAASQNPIEALQQFCQ
jgi:hypothetical protein